jgi:hypothetical protein
MLAPIFINKKWPNPSNLMQFLKKDIDIGVQRV